MQTDVNITYTITRRALTGLLVHCESDLPNEACGLLVSSMLDPSSITIDTIRPIPNVHQNPRSAFTFEPASWIATMYQLDVNQQQLVGYYHSHPTSEPSPSTADTAGMLSQLGAFMLIISFASDKPVMRAYWKRSDDWLPAELRIEQTEDNEEAD